MANKKNKSQAPASFSKPPVVAVMGHVDHGKTSLLDYIRKSRIAFGESGSITQHIGAYQVPAGDRSITFIDTPGHEAFANLRSRGAGVADIALLVIDAKESLKPQTKESIKIIREADIPMIVVLNKMDLPDVNPTKVKQDLLRENVIVEDHGGDVPVAEISAKTGKGIDDLLEMIVLVADMSKVSADPHASLSGTVIETRKDPGRGNVATVIIQSGILHVRDRVQIEQDTFTVRALFDDLGKSIREALPGKPVEIIGFTTTPHVGSLITMPGQTARTQQSRQLTRHSVTEPVLSLFIKADTYGSLEAIVAGLPEEVAIIESEIGDVTESDISDAKNRDLVIIGFNVKIPGRVSKLAKDEGVRIRSYTIIYQLFEEIEEVVELLSQGPQRNIIGEAKILKLFDTSDGMVAGCQIVDGRVARGDKVLIIRGSEELTDSARVKAIRIEKEDVNKVEKGRMCGILLSTEIDMKEGDVIQSYTLYEF